jgi:uncharacterized membrane protein
MRVRASYLPVAVGLAAVGLVLLDHSRHRNRHRAQYYLDSLKDSAMRDVHVHVPLGSAILGAAALLGGGYLLSRELRRGPGGRHTVEESIDVDVPVTTAYNQWTQFEEFPKFMSSVESVTQVDDTHLHWRASVGGKTKEWDAQITEQIPDERIAWRSVGGVRNDGVVTFHKLGDSRTRVMLQMDYEPDTAAERAADAGGAVKLTTKGNLKRFKKLLESRGHETGAWRGSVLQH